MMLGDDKELGLYIHIPFCKSKCYYCDFNSFACRDDFVPAYFNALKKEIALYSNILKDFRIKTVFIGGGTPSLVGAHNIYEVVVLLRQAFNIAKGAEITIETNPGTLSYEKLATYKVVGINRLSIGLQAWQNRLLRDLGRIHTIEEFIENYNLAKKVGFNNINIDLIFGIPNQAFEDWVGTIESVSALEPAHLSCYSLKIEEETVFGRRLESGELVPLDDELDRDMYWEAIERLGGKGYKHYEISNFAKDGFLCRHNLIYWKGEEYIGIGAGAHSYFNGERFNNVGDILEYANSIDKGQIPKENILLITDEDKMSEFMILGLRLIDGICMKEFERKFNKNIMDIYGAQLNSLLEKGFIHMDKGFLKLSDSGLDLANQVFVEFL